MKSEAAIPGTGRADSEFGYGNTSLTTRFATEPTNVVPEPSTAILLGTGLLGLGLVAWRRKEED